MAEKREPCPAAATTTASARTRSKLSWRGQMRLTATIGNTFMVLYVYVAHLRELEWERFGQLRSPGEGQPQRLWDYVRAWELEPAFELLRLLTFSDAMLQNLHIYLIVGTPVSVMLFALERDRVRWLQELVEARLPKEEADGVVWWLSAYFRAVSVMLVFILSIAPFHLGKPRAHYFCTVCALLCGCTAMCSYLRATMNLDRVLACSGDQDSDLTAWSVRVHRWVRPALKLVIGLHVACLVSAVLKAECLGDDRLALAFGVLETVVILGYQLFQAVFVVDDIMMSRGALLLHTPTSKESAKDVGKDGSVAEELSDRLIGS